MSKKKDDLSYYKKVLADLKEELEDDLDTTSHGSKKSSSRKSKKEPSEFKILTIPERQPYSSATQTFMETQKSRKSKSKGGKNKTKKRKAKKTKKNKKNKK